MKRVVTLFVLASGLLLFTLFISQPKPLPPYRPRRAPRQRIKPATSVTRAFHNRLSTLSCFG